MSNTEETHHRVSIEDLLKAGTHFGHLTRRWNPKMKSYIFMERNGIHIIDLMHTQARLEAAANAVMRFSKMGRKVLFVGTKKQAREIVKKHAKEAGAPYTVERWLGGTLTNFQTIRKSIRRMENIQKMEEEGTLAQLKKKERLMKAREFEKLDKVLSGIAAMPKIPGAVFIVDINREHIAVKEARKLNIPIIAIVDTNCDPDLVDYPIPANDDALKSIDLITGVIARAYSEGIKARDIEEATKKIEKEKRKMDTEEISGEQEEKKPRRSRRKKTTAKKETAPAENAPEKTEEKPAEKPAESIKAEEKEAAPAENAPEKAVEKPAEKTEEKPAEKTKVEETEKASDTEPSEEKDS